MGANSTTNNQKESEEIQPDLDYEFKMPQKQVR
jgi:hypothetical protein